ncbi:MAG: D-aminoacylase [Anaerolineaceae bacterium]|nr:D-aminoacylase [Anaerolineaceae bacterium]
MFDLIIKNGLVVDGSGDPGELKDIGIIADRIEKIGDLSGEVAHNTIDAKDMVVAPGFIDIHSHADATLPVLPTADSKVYQGVTTEVVGNCGFSTAPFSEELMNNFPLGGEGILWNWKTFEDYFEVLSKSGISVNVVPLVGHATVRLAVMGMVDREPTDEEMREMKNQVEMAMQSGAAGFTTGLIYPPSVYGSTDEIVELAKVAAKYGGIYTSHIRGEGDTVLEAVDEAIEIGRQAGLPVEISHLKASNRPNWEKMTLILNKIEQAREEGLDITADMYPYPASNTTLTALIPSWAHVGGRDAMLSRLRGAEREKIRQELHAEAERSKPDFWDRVIVSECVKAKHFEGKSVAAVSEEMHKAPEDALMDLLLEVDGEASMIQFMMSEENIALGLKQPFVMIGSDGEGRSTQGVLSGGKPHPRNYGTFARVLRKYVREDQVLTLEEGIHKMTGMPARKMNLQARGLLKEQYFADVVVFDASKINDASTFQDPHQYAQGIKFLFVNGETVIQNGVHTELKPGRILRHKR